LVYRRQTGGDDMTLTDKVSSSRPSYRIFAFGPTYKEATELGERVRSALDGLSGTIADSHAFLIRCDSEAAGYYDVDGSQTRYYFMPLTYTVIYRSFPALT
jgi:hypothetical protein